MAFALPLREAAGLGFREELLIPTTWQAWYGISDFAKFSLPNRNGNLKQGGYPSLERLTIHKDTHCPHALTIKNTLLLLEDSNTYQEFKMVERSNVVTCEAGISAPCLSHKSKAVRLAWLTGLIVTPALTLAACPPDQTASNYSTPIQDGGSVCVYTADPIAVTVNGHTSTGLVQATGDTKVNGVLTVTDTN